MHGLSVNSFREIRVIRGESSLELKVDVPVFYNQEDTSKKSSN
jgi:hypothetical protein